MQATVLNDTESEQVSLHFLCKDLGKGLKASETHGFLTLQLRAIVDKADWHVLGRTEAVQAKPDIDFSVEIDMNFIFESKQKLKAELIETVDDQKNPDSGARQSHQEFIRQNSYDKRPGISRTHTGVTGKKLGEAIFDLADVAGAFENSYNTALKSITGQTIGMLNIRMEKVNQLEKFEYSFDIVISNVPKFHMFSHKNSYIKMLKQRIPDSLLKKMTELDKNPGEVAKFEWITVHQTNVMPGNDARFYSIIVPGEKLCYNNRQILIRFELWKSKKNGKDYQLGVTNLCLNDITIKQGQSFPLKLTQENSAKTTIRFENFKSERIYDFFDFIRGGISISYVVGVDFTLSNVDYKDPKSLHYFDGRNLNLYQKAILSVGEILEKYNQSRQIAAYGFGAKLSVNEPTSHFFPLNLNYQNPFFRQFKEMLEAYIALLPRLTFSGPTNFAPLLRNVLKFAESKFAENKYNYTVLLLLTDGAVTDFQETIDSIIHGCELPLSIIIVGIGNDSFEKMDRLDGNDIPLVSSEGTKMKRDIVRFVSFNKLSNNPILLREEVLRELPGQVVEFYRMRNIPPRTAEEAKQYYSNKGSYTPMTLSTEIEDGSFQSLDHILENGLLHQLGGK